MSHRPPLTDRQQQIYDLIVDGIDTCGYPPTIREIGKQLGIHSTNGVADHLKALKRKGYLTQQGQKSRTWQPIRATPPESRLPQAEGQAEARVEGQPASHRTGGWRHGVQRVPLLGRVAAGEPILAVEEAEGELLVDASWLGKARDVFALTVVGDSMVDDGILDGDTVLVQRRDDADVGDIVVMLIDNEATVKRYYPEAGHIRLQPANAAMQPIYLTANQARNVRLVGTVREVRRRL